MKNSVKFKKKVKSILGGIAVIIILSFCGIGLFFFNNDAPILLGEIEYNVSYNQEQTLDIYHPTQSKLDRSPVLVFIHGGAWIAGRKESINVNRFNQSINRLRNEGYVIITPNYTLAKIGHSPFPQCIIDIYQALEWIKSHAEEYQLDLNNLGVFGESAGAHLAMMIAYGQPSDFGLSHSITPINYVVDIYGPSHLENLHHFQTTDSVKSLLYKLPEKLRSQLDISELVIGVDPKKHPEQANQIMATYSPINYLSSTAPPTLIIHGDADIVVPIYQSELLIKSLDSLKVEKEFHFLTGEINHAFIGASDAQKDSIQKWTADFILKQYKTYP